MNSTRADAAARYHRALDDAAGLLDSPDLDDPMAAYTAACDAAAARYRAEAAARPTERARCCPHPDHYGDTVRPDPQHCTHDA